jgi:hypothetical protein
LNKEMAMQMGLATAFLAITVLSMGVAAQKSVPAEYRGRWVAAKGACESPAAMVVAADRVTLINGKDTETLGDNARILKLNLANRFPLDKVPLKKCA